MPSTFSLIVATVDRSAEPERLLQSLVDQTFRDFEVILVDQNVDDRIERLVSRYGQQLQLTHLRAERGVSRARNAGLAEAKGEIITFPDDDCWYAPDALARRAAILEENPSYDVLSGRSIDETGSGSMGRWDRAAGFVTKHGVWTQVIAFNLFFRRAVCERVGGFDESLGPGAGTPWGACEENDYVLRVLGEGFAAWYDPELTLFHPLTVGDYHGAAESRGLPYGRGMGRVLRKHRFPLWFVAYNVVRPSGGALVELCRGRFAKSQYHWATARGRFVGWASPIDD